MNSIVQFCLVEHAHDRKSSQVYFGKFTRVYVQLYVYATEFVVQRG